MKSDYSGVPAMKLLIRLFVVVGGVITAFYFGAGALFTGAWAVICFFQMFSSDTNFLSQFLSFLSALAYFAICSSLSVLTVLWIRDLTRSADPVNIAADRFDAFVVVSTQRFFKMSVWQIGIAVSFILFAIGLIWSFR